MLRRHRWLRRTLVVGLAVFGALCAGVLIAYATVELPPEPPLAQTSIVYDATGAVLAELHAGEDRQLVSLDDVAPVARDAVVAAEDRDFFHHDGVDPRGIARALWADVRGRPVQGGSTITQQLVKNSWLDPQRSVVRKAREAMLALKLEQRWSKEEILERYLNTIYFGRGAYGIEAAAETYFGVPASGLTLPQAAVLAGLIRSPELGDPARDPQEAERRRQSVLDAMVASGTTTAAEARDAAATPIETLPRDDATTVTAAGSAYFVEHVRRWAVATYGEDTVYGGGLRIETTLDPRLQTAAEDAVAGVLTDPADPAAALVSVDANGAIRAMVGGRDFATSEVNYALGAEGGGTGRQAGSTFKPFVLAAAIEDGIGLGHRFPAPASIELDTPTGPWAVSNYGGESYGSLDLVDATADSVNTVYAQLVEAVGPERVVEVAHRLGITSDLDAVPSLVLGTEEVSPLEMASAYMTFARRGTRIDPFAIVRVRNAEGDVLWEVEPTVERAMPEEQADAVNAVLEGVIEGGTGTAADVGVPAAGKTGTTQEYGDAWFVGYTPVIGTAVWMGYPEGAAHAMTSVHGRRVTGGSFPAQIWQRFMAAALDGVDSGEFVAPPASVYTDTDGAPAAAPTGPPSTAAATTSSLAGDTTSMPADKTTTTDRRHPRTTTTTEPATTTTEPPTTTAPPTTDPITTTTIQTATTAAPP